MNKMPESGILLFNMHNYFQIRENNTMKRTGMPASCGEAIVYISSFRYLVFLWRETCILLRREGRD